MRWPASGVYFSASPLSFGRGCAFALLLVRSFCALLSFTFDLQFSFHFPFDCAFILFSFSPLSFFPNVVEFKFPPDRPRGGSRGGIAPPAYRGGVRGGIAPPTQTCCASCVVRCATLRVVQHASRERFHTALQTPDARHHTPPHTAHRTASPHTTHHTPHTRHHTTRTTHHTPYTQYNQV